MAKNPKNVNPPSSAEPQQELARTTPAATQPVRLLSSAPAWLAQEMAGQSPLGLEALEKADLVMARLVLAQSQTPEVVNADENGHGIVVGDIFDNLSKEIRAKAGQPLRIIPVILGKSRMLFGEFGSDEGILCRSDDALKARPGGKGVDQGGQHTADCTACVLKEFDDSDEGDRKPKCSLFYNIVCMLPDFNMTPVVWSGKHVNVKPMKRFLSTAAMTKAHLFAGVYEIFSVKEKNDKYVYQNFDFRALGWVDESQYNHAKDFYATLADKTWAPDTRDLETPQQSTGPTAAEVAKMAPTAETETPF